MEFSIADMLLNNDEISIPSLFFLPTRLLATAIIPRNVIMELSIVKNVFLVTAAMEFQVCSKNRTKNNFCCKGRLPPQQLFRLKKT